MNYGSGEVKKSDYAKMLAACLTYFAYHQRDAVGILTFDPKAFARTFRRAADPASFTRSCIRSNTAVPAKGTEFKKASALSGGGSEPPGHHHYYFGFL